MKKTMLSIMLTAALVSTSCSFIGVSAKENSMNNPNAKDAITVSQNKNSASFEDQKTNIFFKGKSSAKIQITEKDILTYLENNKSSFTNASGKSNFKIISMKKDNLGYTQVKVTQSINNIPIRGSQFVMSIDKDGVIKNIIGSINKNYKPLDNVKAQCISPKEAINIAKKQFTYTSLAKEPTATTQIVIKDGTPTLVYSVNIYYTEPEIGNWEVLIDSLSGNIVSKESNIRYDGATTGTGTAVDGTNKALNLYKSGSNYQMIDSTKPMSGKIKTYTANNRQVQPGSLVTNTTNKFSTEKFKASVSAHYNAGVVYDFYKNLFGRNSIDDKGMNIISTTHYGRSYDNAYWDGEQMVYGDGDGTEFTYFSGDLDVVAHELTHGVTQNTADLVYRNQSGALNESFSDVFGVLVQSYDKCNVKNGGTWKFNANDWVVGDEIYTPNKPGDALRSLADPTLYDQPDNMKDYVNGSSDNGGVHTNSGIPNKAAFLIAKSIGCDKTAKIYYKALTEILSSTADFSAARNALVSAASQIYGDSSNEVSAVNSAFDSVGITE
ncbi:peptidase M4 family protein [Clostridium sp. P21]|uniref:Neutral metalloproteinase n=1 Tax=Clostridium muellerianum TaxID=2716538 RepID=A0A7Y0EF11_9CLOT|nr:M4 family metallopeptidase [Clostridium muellerianum]NMM62314.1 peptidase M4 family protein [Clostridium muellerianum]